jgi:hypothetical protein
LITITRSYMTKFLRITFVAISFLFFLDKAHGQACTPDPQYTNTDTDRGVYPDSATGFAPAYANSPYMQLVTIVVPPDTQVLPLPFPPTPFDSIVLVNFTGLPPGFTYGCWNSTANSTRCSWPGNSIGCLQINGNPTMADTGTYNLLFDGEAYVGGSTTPVAFTIDYYKIVVNTPVSIEGNKDAGFAIAQNAPNPFRERTKIKYSVPAPCEVKFTVYNMLGKAVHHSVAQAKKGENHIDFNPGQLAPGVYMYTLSHGSSTVTKRMVVEGR